MKIEIEPIGHVQVVRPHAEDDFWGGEQARIELLPQFKTDALAGLGYVNSGVSCGSPFCIASR